MFALRFEMYACLHVKMTSSMSNLFFFTAVCLLNDIICHVLWPGGPKKFLHLVSPSYP